MLRAGDDWELLRRAASGEAEALGDLHDRHAPRVYGLLARLLGDLDEAEDALQETFLQAWRTAAAYDARRSSPAAWLIMIARSRALDRLRSRPRGDAGSARAVDELITTADPGGPLERDEEIARLNDALRQIPEPQRLALALAYFGGLSHPEIAERLNAPLGTIKTRIRMGLERLRALLGVKDLAIAEVSS